MSTRKFYIAFSILCALVILTIAIFTFIVSTSLLQKITGASENKKITLEKPLFNPENYRLGSSNAKLKIVEFGDFLCPYCKEVYPIIKKVVEDYPEDVELVWKHFPNNSSHPTATITAIAAECAGEQGKFWEYHDLIFERQDELRSDDVGQKLLELANGLEVVKTDFIGCLSRGESLLKVKKDFEEGQALGIDGTPYFFINDVIKINGMVSYEELVGYLE